MCFGDLIAIYRRSLGGVAHHLSGSGAFSCRSSSEQGESHATNATTGMYGRTVSEAGCVATQPNGPARRRIMRLWTIHPKYLDPQGLVALWREALLARAVLRGQTRGYRNHPQLDRFRAHDSPRSAINVYLAAIHAEATVRGYAFDKRKIGPLRSVDSIPTTTGQISYEWRHLLAKLAVRNRVLLRYWRTVNVPLCHPLFTPVRGVTEKWERTWPRK